jgi:hypothetical protein
MNQTGASDALDAGPSSGIVRIRQDMIAHLATIGAAR